VNVPYNGVEVLGVQLGRHFFLLVVVTQLQWPDDLDERVKELVEGPLPLVKLDELDSSVLFFVWVIKELGQSLNNF
jgi:hypothetical protein